MAVNQEADGSNPFRHPRENCMVAQWWRKRLIPARLRVRIPPMQPKSGKIAQMVERLAEDQGVGGSIPSLAANKIIMAPQPLIRQRKAG